MRIRINDDNNIPETLRTIDKVNRKKAKVGYMSEGDIKMIAGVHEFGCRIEVTDKMRGYLGSLGLHLKKETTHIMIPERSFIRTGADRAGEAIVEKSRELVPMALAGRVNVEELYKMLGTELKGKIQEYAIDLNNPVNHPFTVEMKGSSNPLVASGNMLQSMEVDVR